MSTHTTVQPFSLGRTFVTALGAFSLVLVSACSPADSPTRGTQEGVVAPAGEGIPLEDMDPVSLSVSTLYGPDNWQTAPMIAYAEAVTDATGGKIEFEFYYDDSLAPAGEMASGLRDGLIDIAHIVPAYTPATFPQDNWINNLSWASDPSPVAGTLQAAAATLDWGLNDEDYLEEIRDEGMVALLPRLQTVHQYGLLCREEVTSLDDARNKRVRVGGEAWSDETENIGAVAVSMPTTEIYTAFQQGLVDCYMGGPEDTHAMGLSDHGEYWTSGNFTGWSSAGLMVSESTWESLPLSAQQIMWEQLPVFLESFFESNFAINAEFAEAAETDGLIFSAPDDEMRAVIDEHHERLSTDLVSSAPERVSDPDGSIEAWMEAHEKWLDIISDELGYSTQEEQWSEVEDPTSIDLGPWTERVYEDLLAPHRPE